MEVPFTVSAEEAFDYTVEPRNRPEWQSSLKGVEIQDDGPPRVGQTWVDVTKPGLRPAMEITGYERPHKWVEQGRWRGVDAELSVTFEPTPTGCVALVEVKVLGRGVARPLGPLLTRISGLAIGPDLRRAAAVLAKR